MHQVRLESGNGHPRTPVPHGPVRRTSYIHQRRPRHRPTGETKPHLPTDRNDRQPCSPDGSVVDERIHRIPSTTGHCESRRKRSPIPGGSADETKAVTVYDS